MASAALTPIVKWLLNKYVSKYVEEMDTRQLAINVFKGEVELNNLTLRPDALEQLHLPFIVRAGRVQNLKIVCPVMQLDSKPVRVEIDGIYLMAARKDELGMAYDAETVAAKALSKKRKQLALIDEVALARAKEEGADAVDEDDAAASAGWFEKLKHKIIDNLQLKITNVHIRYEDPRNGVAAGLSFEKIELRSTDGTWAPHFVVGLPIVHKLAILKRLCVYIDMGTGAQQPVMLGARLERMGDALIADPEVRERHAGSDARAGYEYVLQPVDCRVQIKFSKSEQLDAAQGVQARIEAEAVVTKISLTLMRKQYCAAMTIVEYASNITRHTKYLKYRPARAILDPLADGTRRVRDQGRAERRQLLGRCVRKIASANPGQHQYEYVRDAADGRGRSRQPLRMASRVGDALRAQLRATAAAHDGAEESDMMKLNSLETVEHALRYDEGAPPAPSARLWWKFALDTICHDGRERVKEAKRRAWVMAKRDEYSDRYLKTLRVTDGVLAPLSKSGASKLIDLEEDERMLMSDVMYLRSLVDVQLNEHAKRNPGMRAKLERLSDFGRAVRRANWRHDEDEEDAGGGKTRARARSRRSSSRGRRGRGSSAGAEGGGGDGGGGGLWGYLGGWFGGGDGDGSGAAAGDAKERDDAVTEEFKLTDLQKKHLYRMIDYDPDRDGEKASAARSKLPRDYKVCVVSVSVRRCLLQLFEEGTPFEARRASISRSRAGSVCVPVYRYLLHSEWGPINAKAEIRQGQSFDIDLKVARAEVCDTMPASAGRAAGGIADRLIERPPGPVEVHVVRHHSYDEGSTDSDHSAPLLAVTLKHLPLDEKADICIAVKLQPLDVLFRPSVVWRIVHFFKPPRLLDVSTLQSAALSELSGYAQRQAAAYAIVASRKSLWVDMDICAPDIRIPFDQHLISESSTSGSAAAQSPRHRRSDADDDVAGRSHRRSHAKSDADLTVDGSAELKINLGRIRVHTQLSGPSAGLVADIDAEKTQVKSKRGSLLDSETGWPAFFTDAEEAMSTRQASVVDAVAAASAASGTAEAVGADDAEPVRSWDDLSDCYTAEVSDVGLEVIDAKQRRTKILMPCSLVLRIAASAIPTSSSMATVPKIRVAASLPGMHLQISTSAYDAVMALVLEVIPDAMRTFGGGDAPTAEGLGEARGGADALIAVDTPRRMRSGTHARAPTSASYRISPRRRDGGSMRVEGVVLDQLRTEARRGSIAAIGDATSMEMFAAALEASAGGGGGGAPRVKTLSERGALVLARRLKLLVHFDAPLVDVEVVDDTSVEGVARPLLRAALLRTMCEVTQRTYDVSVDARTSGLSVANLMVPEDSSLRNILHAGESESEQRERRASAAMGGGAPPSDQNFIILSTNHTQRHSPIWQDTASEDRYGLTVELNVGRLKLNADSETAIDLLHIAGRRKMPAFQEVQAIRDEEHHPKVASEVEKAATAEQRRNVIARTAAATQGGSSRMKFAINAGGVEVDLSYDGEPLVSVSLLGVSANSRHALGVVEASATVKHLHVHGGKHSSRGKVLGPLVDDDRFMSMGEDSRNANLLSCEVVFLHSWHPRFTSLPKEERVQLAIGMVVGALGLYVSPSFLVHTSATLFKFAKTAAKALLAGQLAALIGTERAAKMHAKEDAATADAGADAGADSSASAGAGEAPLALAARKRGEATAQPDFLWRLKVKAADVAVVAVLSSNFYPEQSFAPANGDGEVDTLLELRLRRVAVGITNRRGRGVDAESKVPSLQCHVGQIDGQARGIAPLGGPTAPMSVVDVPNFELQLGPPRRGVARPLAIRIAAPNEVIFSISPAIITFVIAIIAEFTWAVNRLKYLAMRDGRDIKQAALRGTDGADGDDPNAAAAAAASATEGEGASAAQTQRTVFRAAAAIAHNSGMLVIDLPKAVVHFNPVRLGVEDTLNVGEKLLRPIMTMHCVGTEMQVQPVEGVVFAMHMGRVDFIDGDLDAHHPAKTILSTGPAPGAAPAKEEAIVLEVSTGGGQVKVGVVVANEPQCTLVGGSNFFRFQEQCAVIRSPAQVPFGDHGEVAGDIDPALLASLPNGLPSISVLVDVECRRPRFWIAPGAVDDKPVAGGLRSAPWLLVRFDAVRSVTSVKREGGVLVENTCDSVMWSTIDAPLKVHDPQRVRHLHSAHVHPFGHVSGEGGLTTELVTVDVDVVRGPTIEERKAGAVGGCTVTVRSTPLVGRFPPELYLCVSPMNDINYVINAFVPPEKCFQIRPPSNPAGAAFGGALATTTAASKEEEAEAEEIDESNPVKVQVIVEGMVVEMCGSVHLREQSWRDNFVVLKSSRISVLYSSTPGEDPFVYVTGDHMVAFESIPVLPLSSKRVAVGRTVLALPRAERAETLMEGASDGTPPSEGTPPAGGGSSAPSTPPTEEGHADTNPRGDAVCVTVTMHPYDTATSAPKHNEVKVQIATRLVARASPAMVGCMYNWWVSEPARLTKEGALVPKRATPPPLPAQPSTGPLRAVEDFDTQESELTEDSEGEAPPVPSRSKGDDDAPPPRPTRTPVAPVPGEEPTRWSVAVELADGFDLQVPLFESDDFLAQSVTQTRGSSDGGGAFEHAELLDAVRADPPMARLAEGDALITAPEIAVHLMPSLTLHVDGPFNVGAGGGADASVSRRRSTDAAPDEVSVVDVPRISGFEMRLSRRNPMFRGRAVAQMQREGSLDRAMIETTLLTLDGGEYSTTTMTYYLSDRTSKSRTDARVTLGRIDGSMTLDEIAILAAGGGLLGSIMPRMLADPEVEEGGAEIPPHVAANDVSRENDAEMVTDVHWRGLRLGVYDEANAGRMPLLRLGISSETPARLPLLAMRGRNIEVPALLFALQFYDQNTLCWEPVIEHVRFSLRCALADNSSAASGVQMTQLDINAIDPLRVNVRYALLLTAKRCMVSWGVAEESAANIVSSEISSALKELETAAKIAAQSEQKRARRASRGSLSGKHLESEKKTAAGFTSFKIVNHTGAAVRLRNSKARRAGSAADGIVSGPGKTTGFELTQLIEERGSVTAEHLREQAAAAGKHTGTDTGVMRGKVLPSATPTVVDAKVDIAIGEYAILKSVPLYATARPQIHLLRSVKVDADGAPTAIASARRWSAANPRGRKALKSAHCVLCSITNADGATQLCVSSPNAVVNRTLRTLALRFGSDEALYCGDDPVSLAAAPSETVFIEPGETYHVPVTFNVTDRLQFGLHQGGDHFEAWCMESVSCAEIRAKLAEKSAASAASAAGTRAAGAVDDSLFNFDWSHVPDALTPEDAAASLTSCLCAAARIVEQEVENVASEGGASAHAGAVGVGVGAVGSTNVRNDVVEGQLFISILPLATLSNLLPQTLAFEIQRESSGAEHEWVTVTTGVLRSGETVQVTDPLLDAGSNAHVRCKFVGSGWNKWSTFVPLRDDASAARQRGFSSSVEHSFGDDDGTLASVTMTREAGDGSSTAVSVRFFCEVWMVNNTRLPLVFGHASGSSSKDKAKLSSSSAIAGQHHAVDEVVYENQQWSAAFPRSWVAARAFVKAWSGPTGQKELTRAKVDNKLRPHSFLGARWEWIGEWGVDKQSYCCDAEGWQFSSTWAYYDKHNTGATGTRKALGREWKAERAGNSVCRRRRWRRRRQIKPSHAGVEGHRVVTFTRAQANAEAKYIVVRVGTSPWAQGVSLARAIGQQLSGQTFNRTAMSLLEPQMVTVVNGDDIFELTCHTVSSGSSAAELLQGSIDATLRKRRMTSARPFDVDALESGAGEEQDDDSTPLVTLTREEQKGMVSHAASSVLPLTQVLVFSPRLLIRNRSGMTLHVRQAGLPGGALAGGGGGRGSASASSIGAFVAKDALIPAEVDLADGDTQPFHWKALPVIPGRPYESHGRLEVSAGRRWGASSQFRPEVGVDVSLLLLRALERRGTSRARKGSDSPDPMSGHAAARRRSRSGDGESALFEDDEMGSSPSHTPPFLILRVTVRPSDLGQMIVTIRSEEKSCRPQYRFMNQTNFPVTFAQVGADQQRWPPFRAGKMESLNFALPESILNPKVEVRVGSMTMHTVSLTDLKANEVVLKPASCRKERHSITPSMRYAQSPVAPTSASSASGRGSSASAPALSPDVGASPRRPRGLGRQDSVATVSRWLKYNQDIEISLSTVDGYAVRLEENARQSEAIEAAAQQSFASPGSSSSVSHGNVEAVAAAAAELSRRHGRSWRTKRRKNMMSSARYTPSLTSGLDTDPVRLTLVHGASGRTEGRREYDSRLRFGDVVRLSCEPLHTHDNHRGSERTLTCVLNKSKTAWNLEWRMGRSKKVKGKIARALKKETSASAKLKVLHTDKTLFIIKGAHLSEEHVRASTPFYLEPVGVEQCVVGHAQNLRADSALRLLQINTDLLMATAPSVAQRGRVDSSSRRRREGADFRAVRNLLEGSWMVARPLFTLNDVDDGLDGADSVEQARAIQLALREGGMFAVPAPPPPSRVYVRVQIVDGIRTLIVTGSSRDRGAGRKTKEESGSRLVLSVGLDAIHVSVYDATPSELLCLSLRELEVRVDTLAEEERQTTVQVNVGDLQLDDQSIRPSNEVIIHPKMAFLTRREREALASAGAAGGGRGQRPSGGGRRSADGGGDTLHLGEGARFLSVAMSMYQWEADSGGTPTLFLKKFKVKILPLVITVGDDIVNTLIAYGTSVGSVFASEGGDEEKKKHDSALHELEQRLVLLPSSSTASAAAAIARDGARRSSPSMELWIATLATPQFAAYSDVVRGRRVSDARPRLRTYSIDGPTGTDETDNLDADEEDELEDLDEDEGDEGDGNAPPIVFYFDEFSISDIKLSINAEIVRPVPLSLEGSQIIVDGLVRDQLFLDSAKLLEEMKRHYYQAFSKQLLTLVFSLEMLGNPISVFQTFADGLNEAGDSYGTSILTKSVLGTGGKAISGVGGAITSVTSAVTMDADFIQQRANKRRGADRPRGVFNTIKASGSSVADGVWGGVTGLVSAPVKGAKKNGALGLFKGLAKGAVGLVAKPVTGIIDAPMIMIGALTDTLDEVTHRDRLCKPRLLRGLSRVLMEWEASDAIVTDVLEIRKCLFSLEPSVGAERVAGGAATLLSDLGDVVDTALFGDASGDAGAGGGGKRGKECYVHHLSPAAERVRRGPHQIVSGAPIIVLFTTRRVLCICDSTRLGERPQPCTVAQWIESCQRTLENIDGKESAAIELLEAEALKSGAPVQRERGRRSAVPRGSTPMLKRGKSRRENDAVIGIVERVFAVKETGRSGGSLLDARSIANAKAGRPVLMWQTAIFTDSAKAEAVCARLVSRAPLSRVSMLDRNQRVCAEMGRRGRALFKPTREQMQQKARMALCMRLVRVLSWLHLGCPPSVNAETMRACWLHIETHAEFAASEADAVSPRTKADGDLGPFKLAILVDAVCMCYERASRDAVTLLQHPYTLLELVSEQVLCPTLDGEAIRALAKFRAAFDSLVEEGAAAGAE